jgi:hypothetical protein
MDTTTLLILTLNIIALLFSKLIFKSFKKSEKSRSLFIFRFINISFIILILINLLIDTNNDLFNRIAWSLGLFYLSVIAFEIIDKIIVYKLGEKRNDSFEETHSSRVMTILSVVFIFFLTIIFFIKIWNLDSALETTGIIGIFIGFLALTASIWAPDLLSGILLLNNSLLNNHDLIELKGNKYIIFKFGFFETVLLNINDNHRTIVKNSELRNNIIDNYNKVASTNGIRESIDYKIGYNQEKTYELFFDKLEDLRIILETKFYTLSDKINEKTPLEMLVMETGDFAITIRFSYYLQGINDIKTTNGVRKIFSLKSSFNKIILIESQKLGISLDTPILLNNNILGKTNG